MSTSSELLIVCSELGAQEREVLLILGRRLLAGQRVYGRLDLARDARDFRREAAAELADALIYGAIREVAAHLTTKESTMNDDDVKASDDAKAPAERPAKKSILFFGDSNGSLQGSGLKDSVSGEYARGLRSESEERS